MNSKNHWSRFLPWTVLAFGLIIRSFAAQASDYVASQVRDGAVWKAENWTPEDLKQFGGEPQMSGDTSGAILVRYHYYVSYYDTSVLSPRWVAHIDTKDSAAAAEKRKGGRWDRGQYRFKPDANVVTFSKSRNIVWVTNADYTNATPTSAHPMTAKSRITRGHMASNLEMKGQGDPDAGAQSQWESFSFANVCPQMQGHNSPIWSTLENDCLELAKQLDRVAVISGPIYANSDSEDIATTEAKKGKCHVPIPSSFYKVIIASVDGQMEAVAFIIPHDCNLRTDQLFDYVVSVRKVEQATGINFMSELGKNDDVEKYPSDELLDLLQAADDPVHGTSTGDHR